MTVGQDPGVNGVVGPTLTRPAFVRPAAPGDEALLSELRDRAFADLGSARGWAMYQHRHAAKLPVLQDDWSTSTRRV
jgi:hypothetical protein